MTTDERPCELARLAASLAAGADVALPDGLLLWRLAGGRPGAAPLDHPASDPAAALGVALEASLSHGERRQGAHYTPGLVAERVAAMAIDAPVEPPPTVVDPTCGGGALLLAAGRALAATGMPIAHVARDLLWGADLEPLAVAVTEAAIALWSGGVVPAPGHLVVADTLLGLRASIWPAAPSTGFDLVVANPPFQGQLGRGTVRAPADTEALRARFGAAVPPYVDTAALFLLAATDLVRSGGRVVIVLPQSVAAARDAGPVREALAARSTLSELWAPPGRPFGARVSVCAARLEVGAGDGRSDWSARLARARGVPTVTMPAAPTIESVAQVVASFRDEYYALAAHVSEAGPVCTAPLVTSGLIDVGRGAWGDRPVRFAKQTWDRPEVALDAVRTESPRARAWLDRVLRPKVVVASQTRVIEAAADTAGTWVPCTPALSVVPHDPADVERLAAVLCAPPVAAWAVARAAGTALSADAIRVSARLVAEVPLPADPDAWAAASAALAAHDLGAFASLATQMYLLDDDEAASVGRWWCSHVPGGC